MRSRRLAVLVLVLALASSRASRADTIFVGTREIHGEVVEEDDERVVVIVAGGKLTFPRKQVTKIVRESEVETLLGEARALAKLVDPKALGVFARAIEAAKKAGDETRLDAATKEKDALAARLEKEKKAQERKPSRGPAARVSTRDELFLLEKDEEEVRVLEKAFKEGDAVSGQRAGAKLFELANRHHVDREDRWAVGCLVLARELDAKDAKVLFESELTCRKCACGAAVRARDAKVAAAAIAPVVLEKPRDAHVAYLEGRAHEIAKKVDAAKASYRRALESVSVPGIAELEVDWLRELARRHAAGKPIGEGTPGYGPSWRAVESSQFVVYHELGEGFRDEEVTAFEKARREALERLGFGEEDVGGLGRLPLYIFKDHDSYVRGGGIEWAGGHATGVELEDGLSPAVYTYPGRRLATDTIRHELAHVFVDSVLPDLVLPMWAVEGVACWCETDRSLAKRRREAATESAAGTLVPLADFLGRVTVDQGDHAAIVRFYSESTVVFSLLATKAGGARKALELAAKIARRGADPALKELGLDTASLEVALKADLANAPAGE